MGKRVYKKVSGDYTRIGSLTTTSASAAVANRPHFTVPFVLLIRNQLDPFGEWLKNKEIWSS
ncbi:MAG TPA: hypothetical protein VFY68_11255 [Nitrososphaeraceae archaeon]|nr:hypothetical protein [Nitrososphaeraceae archaeon]